jgi:transcription-repair coupling factor (superfamily II helicase)
LPKTGKVESNYLLSQYANDGRLAQLAAHLAKGETVQLKDAAGSLPALLVAALINKGPHLVVAPDNETAAFFYHDVMQLLGEERVFYLPSSYKRSPEYGQHDTQSVILRTEALNRISQKGVDYVWLPFPKR